MVAIDPDGADRFYVIQGTALQDIVIRDYKDYLKPKKGIRESFHTTVEEWELKEHKDDWKAVGRG